MNYDFSNNQPTKMSLEIEKNVLESNSDNKIIEANSDVDNQMKCTDIESEHQKNSDKDALDNAEEDIDPLDLIANCNDIGGDLISDNSDVWKCSDTDEESFTNQKDVDNQLNDNTDEMNLIDDNVMKEKPKDDNIDDDNGKNDHNKIDDNEPKSTECLNDDLKEEEKIEKTDNNANDENKDEITDNAGLSVDSPDTENKTDDEIGVNLKETTEESTNIINDRKGDDSGDSGISDIITQNTDKNTEENPITSTNNNSNHEENDNDEMDYSDFDPSLLCPEVSMAVDEASVIEEPTNNDNSGPLPYEASFSTYVDEVTGAEISFNLTAEEQKARAKRYTQVNPIEYTRIHCTACNIHLGSALEAQNNRFVHPLLKVLICKKCYNFYMSGEFEKDEDGSELYCRWCGQGGQVLCCSKCECVFCKKCIKTNFGRRKLDHIKNSDDWVCFKCNPSQLNNQRIACFELFEYVRRETARAATLNDPEFLSTDHSVCCKTIKQSDPLDVNKEKKKPKKKKNGDPEYDPLEENQPATKKMKMIAPKQTTPLINNNNNNNFITPIATIGSPTLLQQPTFLIHPSSTIIQTPQTINLHRPNIINSQNFRPNPPTLVRINSTNQTTSTTQETPSSLLRCTLDLSKHEWFEKTVRSTARVNAHLSYTLTQLSKQQSQAGSLEELAVVHNKLQEVLSTSINSLIQIRKNLRSEFIAGIKKVRLPPRKFDCTNTNKDDDDVIFVSAGPSITISKPILIAQSDPTSTEIINIIHTNNNNNNNYNKNTTISIGDNSTGFLKVKSVGELQNVPSECITIPDDPLPNETLIETTPEETPETTENSEKQISTIDENRKDTIKDVNDINAFEYNITDPPTKEVKRMKSAYVKIERSPLIK